MDNPLTKENNPEKKGVKEFFISIGKMYWRPEMNLLPGQLAFFIILSLVPLITLIGYTASFFGLSIDPLTNLISTSLSPGVANMIEPIITGDINISLLIVFITMLYIASNGPSSIIVTSNTVYDIKGKSWLKRRIKALTTNW